MKKFREVFLMVALILLNVGIITAQQSAAFQDTLPKKSAQEKKDESNKGTKGNGGKTGIKQVRSGRPDMIRANGARPPSVTRPSGSRIPKGVGKPAGARGPGRK
jgi:hypothetical protein